MCYGNPHELLKVVLEANGAETNDLGHTALEDFDHFCAYTGLTEADAGPLAFAWAKLAFVSAWKPVRTALDTSIDATAADPLPADGELSPTLTRDSFLSQLRMFLRDRGAGTTAELAPHCIAWWNGAQLVFAYLDVDDMSRIEEEFDLDDCVWDEWIESFGAWLIYPKFGFREDVRDWSSRGRSD
ncbi:hypothetical protein [Paraburkholderia xenovorans]